MVAAVTSTVRNPMKDTILTTLFDERYSVRRTIGLSYGRKNEGGIESFGIDIDDILIAMTNRDTILWTHFIDSGNSSNTAEKGSL